jgi:hypothetical protein
MIGIHGGLDFHGGIFLMLAFFYFVSISADPPEETKTFQDPATSAVPKTLLIMALCVYGSEVSVIIAFVLLAAWAPVSLSSLRRFSVIASSVGFAYGFLSPMLGLQMMASSTMYGNVKNYGGSNHMLVPTGLLQDWLADPAVEAAAPAWLSDFSGGLVRVDSTTSSTLRQLQVHGAEVTNQLPPRARELLASVNSSGRYFEFYSARNYFDRKGDLDKCALNAITASDKQQYSEREDPSYVVPAYELRRALAIARSRKEAFHLKYTRLPRDLRTPTAWKSYVGPSVELQEFGSSSSCAVVPTSKTTFFTWISKLFSLNPACDQSELVRLPPPHWWLTKFLHPYPTPLLEGAGDGIHCST